VIIIINLNANNAFDINNKIGNNGFEPLAFSL